MDTFYLFIIFAGFGGGLVRGLVGYIKNHLNSASTKFEYLYFLLMMFLSGVVGILTAAAVNGLGLPLLGSTEFTPALAFVVGYAGGDLLENIYKIILKKPTI